jgi:hypothetical protein
VCFFHQKFSQLHLRLFNPFFMAIHGYKFITANQLSKLLPTFLENSRSHGYGYLGNFTCVKLFCSMLVSE